jgi:hypothetical protein
MATTTTNCYLAKAKSDFPSLSEDVQILLAAAGRAFDEGRFDRAAYFATQGRKLAEAQTGFIVAID